MWRLANIVQSVFDSRSPVLALFIVATLALLLIFSWLMSR